MDTEQLMSEIAQWTRLQEETRATLEGLKDQLKAYMTENGLEVLQGSEHKATYKPVTSSRIDTAALKKGAPDVAALYTKQTTSNRFTFA